LLSRSIWSKSIIKRDEQAIDNCHEKTEHEQDEQATQKPLGTHSDSLLSLFLRNFFTGDNAAQRKLTPDVLLSTTHV